MDWDSKPQPLTDRPVNTSSPSRPADKGSNVSKPSAKMLSTEGRKQDQNETYISPSDALLSPTTKKLNQMKGKRFGSNNIKPQSLFAKTVDKQAQCRPMEDAAVMTGRKEDDSKGGNCIGNLPTA